MKTIGVFQLSQKRFIELEFTGLWADAFGKPETNFSAIIYGPSGNGKTEFCVQFAKYLSNFKRVLYFSREEGISKTIQKAFERNNMIDCKGRVILGEKGNFESLYQYLEKKNSTEIVIIDSIDYMKLTAEQYRILVTRFPRKAFILISWNRGAQPKSQAGKDIEYMCDIKIHVKQYQAYVRSRFGGNKPFVIWPDKVKLLKEQQAKADADQANKEEQ